MLLDPDEEPRTIFDEVVSEISLDYLSPQIDYLSVNELRMAKVSPERELTIRWRPLRT